MFGRCVYDGAIIELGANKNVVSSGGAGVGSATVQLTSNGIWLGATNFGGSGEFTSTWITPASSALAALYDVFATLNSGTLTSGTTGSALNLGTTRSWTKIGAGSVELTLEIRLAGTSIVVDSVDVTLTGD